MHCHFICTKHVGSSGTSSLLTCVREVSGSNFGRDTGSADWGFFSGQENADPVP
jgi:hypothetical protein